MPPIQSPTMAASARVATVARHLNSAPKVEHITVFGAGLMGAGIAQVAATAGYKVKLVDVNQKAVDTGLGYIRVSLQRIAKKLQLSPEEAKPFVDKVLAGIQSTTDRAEGAKDADLIIEAIVEKLDVKQELFEFLDKTAKTECIFATNTSSLLVGDISSTVSEERKTRFGGMHYFNPVPLMKLCEVIRTDKTSDQTVATIYEVNKRMDKTSVLAPDKPGFIFNRLLSPYNREAVKMLERGDATAEDIDTTMKLGGGYPMGPFELMDMTGIDLSQLIAKEWMKYNQRGLVPDYLTGQSPLLMKMVAEGRTGRKSGRGFYEYDKNGRRITKKEESS